jgi:integrase
MSQLYDTAMRETPPIVTVNPFAGLELPVIRPSEICYFEHEEAAALYDAVEELSGRGTRTMVELGMTVGLRPGELYGLHAHRVNWLRGTLTVVDVMTRSGLRQWPKSKRSHRTVPVPPAIMTDMSGLMAGRARNSLMFTAPSGGPVDDGNFRDRIWYPAIEKSGVRRFPPKVMRHTAASWLVMDGVPLMDVRDLLGHESYRTTERYAHLAPDAHDRVIQSWQRRTNRAADARVTHER